MSDIDLKNVPGDDATDEYRRAWTAALFSAPNGSGVGEVVRYGATPQSPMTVEIRNGDKRGILRIEEERHVQNASRLRAALADVGLRGATITNAKTAGDVYYVLCSLARVVGRIDPLGEAQEWIDELRDRHVPITGHELTRTGVYAALEALQRFPYSKRVLNLWKAAEERGQPPHELNRETGEIVAVEPPRPPLLITPDDREWISMAHLGTFVRHDLERAEGISADALCGRILELGGERRHLNVWDRSDRKRKGRIEMRLIALPPEPEMPAEDDLDGLGEVGV